MAHSDPTAIPAPSATVLHSARALLHRYAAVHDSGPAVGASTLPAELQRWVAGDGPSAERVARARATDPEIAALRGQWQQWKTDGEQGRWRRLLGELCETDAERDTLALLLAEALSPRTGAALRVLSGWADAAGIERGFLQAVIDPLEVAPQVAADALSAGAALVRCGVIAGLQDRTEHRLQFARIAPQVLAWLGHGPDAAARGEQQLQWHGTEPDPLWREPLVRGDIERAQALLTAGEQGPGRLRIHAATQADAVLLARGAAVAQGRGLVVCDARAAIRRSPGEATWLDAEALQQGMKAAVLLAVLADAALMVVGLAIDDGSRAVDVQTLVQVLKDAPQPLLIEDAASADTTSVATGLGRELGAASLTASFPDRGQRKSLWQATLSASERQRLGDAGLLRLAAFPLTAAQIVEVSAELRSSLNGFGDLELCCHACRERVGHRVGDVAQRVTATATWEQVVLPAPVLAITKEIIAFAKHGEKVLDEWGFAARYHYGLGLSALFSGPPGTGKTMLAGLIARELGLDLFRVDLSRVLSKYIGETEQRLGKMFEEGKRGGVALLFDEADSLFARRTEVRSSVDRYANLEVNFLLQKMEEHSGVVILTTNFADSIDEAFKRRIRFHAQFPLPGEEERERLWEAMIPQETPLEEDLPFDLLAKAYEFSGGEIKNAVLRAAFYAAVENSEITLELLDKAAQAECQERGRLVLRTAASLRW